MFEKVKEILKDPKEMATAAAGIAVFYLYYRYARKEMGIEPVWDHSKNDLEMNVTDLVNDPKREDIIKIAITESTKTKCELRRTIISTVKK